MPSANAEAGRRRSAQAAFILRRYQPLCLGSYGATFSHSIQLDSEPNRSSGYLSTLAPALNADAGEKSIDSPLLPALLVL